MKRRISIWKDLLKTQMMGSAKMKPKIRVKHLRVRVQQSCALISRNAENVEDATIKFPLLVRMEFSN